MKKLAFHTSEKTARVRINLNISLEVFFYSDTLGKHNNNSYSAVVFSPEWLENDMREETEEQH